MSIIRNGSLRGLLSVMPSRDFRFYGVSFRWVGIGVIVTRKNESGPEASE